MQDLALTAAPFWVTCLLLSQSYSPPPPSTHTHPSQDPTFSGSCASCTNLGLGRCSCYEPLRLPYFLHHSTYTVLKSPLSDCQSLKDRNNNSFDDVPRSSKASTKYLLNESGFRACQRRGPDRWALGLCCYHQGAPNQLSSIWNIHLNFGVN